MSGIPIKATLTPTNPQGIRLGFLTLPKFESAVEPSIDYQTDDDKSELFEMLAQHMQKVLPQRHTMAAVSSPPNSQ